MVHMLAAAATKNPNAIALSYEGVDLTYRNYAHSVGVLAQRLGKLGARGERIVLFMGNSADMAIAMFAVHAAGAQAVPVNPIYTARELGYIVSDALPVATIHDAAATDLIVSLPNTGKTISSVGTSFITTDNENHIPLQNILPRPDDLATLQYTGGTTGYPKGVNITHRQMSVNISQREAILPTRCDTETVACVMPLFHVFAVSMCLHLTAYCRGRLVIIPRYHPKTLTRSLGTEKITILPAGPTIFAGLLNYDGFVSANLDSLVWCYSGSAPLPEETLRRWENTTGCFILEGYGQTEAGPILTYNPANGRTKPGSVGIPLHKTKVQVVDLVAGTKIQPPGETGEIRARGPQIMTGYRNLAEETEQTLRDGWLYTGDIGAFDSEGYLYIRDRKKDMVIVGGYNVFPREIDEILYTHPAVMETASIGIPDQYYGEIIKAWVTLKPDTTASEQELKDHCSRNLAKYKVPASIILCEEIPKTTIGKIDKNALRS